MSPEIKSSLIAIGQFVGILAVGGAVLIGSMLHYFG